MYIAVSTAYLENTTVINVTRLERGKYEMSKYCDGY